MHQRIEVDKIRAGRTSQNITTSFSSGAEKLESSRTVQVLLLFKVNTEEDV